MLWKSCLQVDSCANFGSRSFPVSTQSWCLSLFEPFGFCPWFSWTSHWVGKDKLLVCCVCDASCFSNLFKAMQKSYVGMQKVAEGCTIVHIAATYESFWICRVYSHIILDKGRANRDTLRPGQASRAPRCFLRAQGTRQSATRIFERSRLFKVG